MPSRRALLSSVGAASASLAGCNSLFGDGEDGESRHVPDDWTPASGEWGGQRYDQANSGHNPHASPPRTKPSMDWADDQGRGSIRIADGTVFHRSTATLRGLDATDGSERFAISRLSGSFSRYVDGRLYDATIDGIAALNLDGQSAWDERVNYDDPVGSLIERDGIVFLSTGMDTIHHHDADTGERVDATVHDTAVRDLANHDGILYAALADGLVAYDVAADGSLEEEWRHRIDGESDLEPRFVVVGDDRVYLTRRRGRETGPSAVDVIDVAEGAQLGTLEFHRSADVVAVGEYAYVSAARRTGSGPTDGELFAFDGLDRVWSVEVEPAPGLAGGGDVLCVGAADIDAETSRVIALDAKSGDELWSYEGAFPQAVVGEAVYAMSADGRLVALRE